MLHPRSDYTRIQDPENKIPANEPVFLIRAQDESAVATLRFWIRQQRKSLKRDLAEVKAGRMTMTPETLGARRKAITMAEAHVYRMEEWTPQKPADA